jgi:EAL domain-containing protein (putative c-di-GMP-specific phosphodiesterase class I)
VLCAQLQLEGVAILRGGAGGLSVLAADGMPRWMDTIDRMTAIPAPMLATKIERPWIEEPGRGLLMAPVVTAVAPLRVDDDAFGLLVLGGAQQPASVGSASTGDRLLAETVDFALVVARLLGTALAQDASRHAGQRALLETIRERRFVPVFQPIIDLRTREVAGYEALTRFDDRTPPHERFADAARCGLGPQLELATMAAAIDASRGLHDDAFVSLNVSPDLVLDHADEIRTILDDDDRPAVLELTEHEAVPDYDAFRAAIAGLRPRVRLSVDDAGAGFSSLRHIVQLEPDYVKLDRSWVAGIDQDPTRQALVAGLAHFTRQTAATLIAEGIETEAERHMVETLDVAFGQGFLLGRPEAIS